MKRDVSRTAAANHLQGFAEQDDKGGDDTADRSTDKRYHVSKVNDFDRSNITKSL
jgi:hypothetical protein